MIDYRNKSPSEVASSIRAALNGRGSEIKHAFDCVSSDDTVASLGEALAPQGGQLTTVLESAEKAVSLLPESVAFAGRTAVRTAHGENAEFAEKLYRLLGQWLDEGRFRSCRVCYKFTRIQSSVSI